MKNNNNFSSLIMVICLTVGLIGGLFLKFGLGATTSFALLLALTVTIMSDYGFTACAVKMEKPLQNTHFVKASKTILTIMCLLLTLGYVCLLAVGGYLLAPEKILVPYWGYSLKLEYLLIILIGTCIFLGWGYLNINIKFIRSQCARP